MKPTTGGSGTAGRGRSPGVGTSLMDPMVVPTRRARKAAGSSGGDGSPAALGSLNSLEAWGLRGSHP